MKGPFCVTGDDGNDITPKGMKERALLVLLLLGPSQGLTRGWLQDKLRCDVTPHRPRAVADRHFPPCANR